MPAAYACSASFGVRNFVTNLASCLLTSSAKFARPTFKYRLAFYCYTLVPH
jgi:hypothetical protein